jgi:hypothetical protein
LLPQGPVVIGCDDTIERRRGAKISAKGIYRDPVRSSHSHFVKTSGLRWLSLMAQPHGSGLPPCYGPSAALVFDSFAAFAAQRAANSLGVT